ncbi:hypothetical protein RvY_04751 [Ramazzottius varieornatus]|uniref:Purine nucleoside phosphorylase n=1 Tax=Ramazzottius varieornatus TaxID=947166 RepID=A0A1D1V1V6_RAMVA|nr:hypothetical protein RvY_04751 [Ramazzottius varieornatus]
MDALDGMSSRKTTRPTCEQFRHSFEEYDHIVNVLRASTGHRPSLAIICGSGLGGLADLLTDTDSIEYDDIPFFPISTVHGHVGRLVFGMLNEVSVVCMQGRFHFYEGWAMQNIAIPVRVFKLLGVQTIIVTNASGAVNPDYKVGDIMLIKDHINLPGMIGANPLMGLNDARWGPRFPALSLAYDRQLLQLARKVALGIGFGEDLREGVYMMVSGPTFETVAEARAGRILGADCMGMSTAPEVIVAKHCGMRVLGISLITNIIIQQYDRDDEPNHQEVLMIGQQRAANMQLLVAEVVKQIGHQA